MYCIIIASASDVISGQHYAVSEATVVMKWYICMKESREETHDHTEHGSNNVLTVAGVATGVFLQTVNIQYTTYNPGNWETPRGRLFFT